MATCYVFVHLPGTRDAVPAGKLVMATDASGDFADASLAYGNQYLD